MILVLLFYCSINFLLYAGVMGCGAAEATDLGFVCFVVINPCVLSAYRVYFGIFCCCFLLLFHKSPIISKFPSFYPPPPPQVKLSCRSTNPQFKRPPGFPITHTWELGSKLFRLLVKDSMLAWFGGVF